MKKPLKFHELSEFAKKTAANEVYQRGMDIGDWHIHADMISESIKFKIEEFHLDCGEITWEDNYGLDMDLSSVETNKEFYKSILTEEELELMDELNDISTFELDHVAFNGTDIFYLEGDYSSIDTEDALGFINEHGNEEEKAKIAFLSLMVESGDDLTVEQSAMISTMVVNLAESLTDKLSEKIAKKLSEIKSALYELLRYEIDYYTYDYYYNCLNTVGTWQEDAYRFNEKGNIVEIEGEILDDYKDEFESTVHGIQNDSPSDEMEIENDELTFQELNENAKRIAATEVYKREYLQEKWGVESNIITEVIQAKINEFHLAKSSKVLWKIHEGNINIDLQFIEPTVEFYESVLRKDQLEVMKDLDVLSSTGITFKMNQGYNFEFIGDYALVETEKAIDFVEKYGREKDIRNLGFIVMLLNGGNTEKINRTKNDSIQEIVEPLVQYLIKNNLENVIRGSLRTFRDSLYKEINDKLSYFKSINYYYDKLNQTGTRYEKYKFNEEGRITAVNDETITE